MRQPRPAPLAAQILAVMAGAMIWLTAQARGQDLTSIFAVHDAVSTVAVDHGAWSGLLKTFVTPEQGGLRLNRVDYARFRREGRERLDAYLAALQAVDVVRLNRNEQFAFWVNLYNARTVAVILDHYPVDSIRDIGISPGLFAIGPWGAKLVEVNGVALSLDNIEHDILRKIWSDPRVHYAVNCASVGCPNLRREAYTGARLDDQLDRAARAYVNSPRGVAIKGGRLTLSSIYKWYLQDFGSHERQILPHLIRYAEPALARRLKRIDTVSEYAYDWLLNDIAR